ncbi:Uncharacterised protein [Vibrio cholerae]|nr:Uncharacterised protein [Vibrio cholerae]
MNKCAVQLGHHAIGIRHLVARMQSRKFDRDRRRRAGLQTIFIAAYRFNRHQVIFEILVRIGRSQRRFTQHIKRIGITLITHRATIFLRFFNGASKHKLMAHDLHGLMHGFADHRFSQLIH